MNSRVSRRSRVSLAFSILTTFSLFFKFENQESLSPILQTKNPLEILETSFRSDFFLKVVNKKSNSNTDVYTYVIYYALNAKSSTSPNKHFSHYKDTFLGLTKMCLLWVGTVFNINIYDAWLIGSFIKSKVSFLKKVKCPILFHLLKV